MKIAFRSFFRRKDGGTAIEYAMLASMIVIGLLVAINSIGGSTVEMYENLDESWDTAAGP